MMYCWAELSQRLFSQLASCLLGLCLGKAGFASTYGATVSIVVLVVWVYYSGQSFFLGAEFTRVFAYRHGSRPERPQGQAVETNLHPG
jgi:membrane protein